MQHGLNQRVKCTAKTASEKEPGIMSTLEKRINEVPNQILFSDKQMILNEINDKMPAGYRQVFVREIASRFFKDPIFRSELYKAGEIWAADTGLRSTGPFRIDETGSFSSSTYKELNEIPEGHASFHYRSLGTGKVVAKCSKYGISDTLALYLDDEYRLSRQARVAYVIDDKHTQMKDEALTVSIPIREFNEAADALKKAERSMARMPHTGEMSNFISVMRNLLRDRT